MKIAGQEINLSQELLLTWSKKYSLLSSKKIIQNSSYTFGSLTLIFYVLGKTFCWNMCKEYDAIEACMVAGTFFTIGGYNTNKLLDEKKNVKPVVTE